MNSLKATVADVRVLTRVRIGPTHPSFAGRVGIVTYLEPPNRTVAGNIMGDGLVTVQLDRLEDSDGDKVQLPISFPWIYIYVLPLQVPTFTSQDQAEEWLEHNNPVAPPPSFVPKFQSPEQADAWAEDQRLKRAPKNIRAGGPPRPGESPKPKVVGFTTEEMNGLRWRGSMEEQFGMQVLKSTTITITNI